MTTQVKICGLMNEADLDTAIENGADYVGLVFFDPSPRCLALADARRLADHARGRTRIVALTVDADDALIERIAQEVAPDIFQLHGSETIARIEQIAALTGAETMKVIKVRTAADAETAFEFAAVADHILFDAKAPEGSPLPGGNGLTFDWRALEGIGDRLAYMLSGGLTADNVADAIRLTGAPAVDVSSGVESAPGKKDPARIRAFLQAAKAL
jgi:phosphoribosylanthranilate isomerase